jgi:hypothetical protein
MIELKDAFMVHAHIRQTQVPSHGGMGGTELIDVQREFGSV